MQFASSLRNQPGREYGCSENMMNKINAIKNLCIKLQTYRKLCEELETKLGMLGRDEKVVDFAQKETHMSMRYG